MRSLALALACALPAAGFAATTFQPRDIDGDGIVDAYYNPDQNLTWLADADYARTSGYVIPNPQMYENWNGEWSGMTLQSAAIWAQTLSIGGVTGWRLPRVSGGCLSDCSYTSEFDPLWNSAFVSDAQLPFSDMQGNRTFQTGNLIPCSMGGGVCQLFVNFTYGHAFMSLGDQTVYAMDNWAVHDGDVPSFQLRAQALPIPEPSSIALLALGIAALLARLKLTDMQPRDCAGRQAALP